MRSIEAYYGGRRIKYVGASMYDFTNYCDTLSVHTPYYTRSRSGDFSLFVRHVYSPNYAVPTLSVYHEEYYLVEMSVSLNWWLLNRVWYNDRIAFQLNGYFEPMYYVSATITTTIGIISIAQALNYNYHNKQSTSPTPISLLF
jgi:hypothetical protein